MSEKAFIVSLNFAVSGAPADVVAWAVAAGRATSETLALERAYNDTTEHEEGVRFLGASVLKTVALEE